MAVAYRFRWFGWFVLCVGVILGCYLMSLRVAAERRKVVEIERSIATTEREIRALETEFDTRASLARLEQWNGDTLRLSAPTAAQYVRDGAALASIDFNRPPGSSVQVQAASIVPSAPAVPGAVALPQVAATAARDTPRPQAASAQASAGSEVRAPTRAVAMLDRKLLSDRTLGDLVRVGRSEGGLR
ncbi:hypothetical protein [uncultured Sphingomonas sp.]|uniref:hypothetical protein n=1 Tax=uncultured Sphingomonas sp. TaxID=158754 RepID=UPI0035CB7889